MSEVVYNNCGVYLIISPTNGRYVGSSKNLNKRFNRYKNLACKNQYAIYASLKKHGFDNHKFIVLKNCEESELLFWERCFGDIYLASANFPNGLNIVLPGYDDVPKVLEEKFRKQVSLKQIERFKNVDERVKTSISTKAGFTDEVRKMMSTVHKNRFNNPELRKERSEVRKQFYINNPNAKVLASEKTKQVLSERPELKEFSKTAFKKYYEENPTARRDVMIAWHKNNPEFSKDLGRKNKERFTNNPELRKIVSEKTKEQLSKYGHPMSKKVINTETNEIFDTLKLAAKSTKYCENTFREIIKGRHKIKLPFQYLENKKVA